MEFLEVLDQVSDLLRSRGRITYRALKLQFHLDDEFIDVLKDELIKGQQLAVDENEEVLVWSGSDPPTQESTSRPRTVDPLADSQDDLSTPIEEPPAELYVPDAERRQLTVMFCDLVDSTTLSGRLDPEDLREVVRAYQEVAVEVVQRYDGHIAQYLGDGLLVYFGYPVAHEDDAQRAVHTALEIVEALSASNVHLTTDYGVQLAVRIGIHTGPVVVGEMGGGGRHEQLALGETPNVAARIQGLAESNTLIISEATYRLVYGFFDSEPLGEHVLQGVSEVVSVYRVLQPSGAKHRLDVKSPGGLTPLVGRESEVRLLQERWNQANTGMGQVVLLSGEPGLGKSRLVQTIKEHLVGKSHTRLECRSSPYYQHTALYPIVDLMQRALQWRQDDSADEKLDKLEQVLSQYRLALVDTVPLMASLLSLSLPEERYPPLTLTPQRKRQKTLETIVAMVLELAENQPVLFIVEDLHWTDPSTLELLALLIDQTPTASLLTLLTCRPEFQHTWMNRSYFAQVTLNRLSGDGIEQIATQVAGGQTLPDEVLQQLVEKTDGVPLYVEEMTKAVLESGALKAANGQYELVGSFSSLTIPSTLQDSLMARLDRLVTAKAVAQYAAVIGRQFSYALLQAVSQLDEAMLQHELERLVESELLYQRGLPPNSTYTFKHALVQDTAYESLLRRTRQGYHGRIAEVLKEQFPEIAATQPELIAYHCTAGDLYKEAIGYWREAGQLANQRSAFAEAIAHLTNALELLHTLPNTPERAQQELTLHITLGPVLIITKGYAAPEVRHTYEHARALCQQVGETSQLFAVLWGLTLFYSVRAELQTALELAEQLLSEARRRREPELLLGAYWSKGVALFVQGNLRLARSTLEEGIALYTPRQHGSLVSMYGQNPVTTCLSYNALALWLLGFPEQARTMGQEMLRMAQELAHSHGLARALGSGAFVLQCLREWLPMQEQAEAAVRLSCEHGFSLWEAIGTILWGSGMTQQGSPEAGIELINRGLAGFRDTGTGMLTTYFLSLLAEAYGMNGQMQEGLTILHEALTLAHTNGEGWWEAELYRLQGELLRQVQDDSQMMDLTPEGCFLRALASARDRQAKSLELRAAISLAHLWHQQDKREEAYDLLAPVFKWFTEGFDTADLREAKALLDALA